MGFLLGRYRKRTILGSTGSLMILSMLVIAVLGYFTNSYASYTSVGMILLCNIAAEMGPSPLGFMIGNQIVPGEFKVAVQSLVILAAYITMAIFGFIGPILFQNLEYQVFFIFSTITALLLLYVIMNFPEI